MIHDQNKNPNPTHDNTEFSLSLDLNKELEEYTLQVKILAERVLDICVRAMDQAQYSDENHFSFMAYCFLCKQIDHMRSVLILGKSKDVELIVRCMVEGLVQLLWASKDPEKRGAKWRNFAWVEDYRHMVNLETNDIIVTDERRNKISEGIASFGPIYYKASAKKALNKGNPLPKNPYQMNWIGISNREMFEALKGEFLYDNLYSSYSKWQHWSPGGIGQALDKKDGITAYMSGSPNVHYAALTAGVVSLIHTAQIVHDHTNSNMRTELLEVFEEYNQINENAVAAVKISPPDF